MNVFIFTTTSEARHTEADRVEEHGSFLCVYEGEMVYKYNTAFITYLIESPNEIVIEA
ncbi:hypothetical protein BH09PAT1_BH09PAT1_1530 [soil metagenome]